MSLHIILGLVDNKPNSPVSVVYAGRSGHEARIAQAQSSAPRFLIFNNPVGLPKNNPRSAANAVVEAAADLAPVQVSHEELHQFRDEMGRLQKVAADRSVEIEQLKAKLAAIETPVEESKPSRKR
jgi:hypothetical protein